MTLRLITKLTQLWRRLRYYWRREEFDRELEEEIGLHLELKAAAHRAAGMSPGEARRAARREFGSPTLAQEESREMWAFRSAETLWQDLRYGLRMIRRSPGFTAVAVLSLALGIGANTAIFSILDAVLLRSLPVREPGRLVLFGGGESMGITDDFPDRSWGLFSYPFYREVRRRNGVFAEVAAIHSLNNRVHGVINAGGDPEQLDARLVSGTYFSALGVSAALGRTFTEADDRVPGGHPVIVASHAWWERRFARDPAVIGRPVAIGPIVYTVIGVAPPEFFGTTVGESPDVWVPLAMEEQLPPGWKGLNDRFFQSLHLVARLKDGVGREQANVELNLLFKQILQEYAGPQPSPERAQGIQRANIELTPAGHGLSPLRQQFSLPLRVLMAVVGVVLLIACANVANLLLARATARAKEFAVRIALGAGRGRVIRQLLTESVLLASLGGALGVALAWWGSRALVLMASSGPQPLPLDVSPDARVLAFTLLLSLASAVVFGTIPAIRATRLDLTSALKESRGAVSAAARSPLGKALVVAQVALSLLLLVGAGLFVRTLINLYNIDTGFSRQNVVVFQLDPDAAGYKEDARLAHLFREVEERVGRVPGVSAAAFSMFTFNQGQWSAKASARGFTPQAPRDRVIVNNVVGQGFFTAMGLPLLLGRGFGPQDAEQAPKVAVINETMARRFFPEGSPLGRRFGLGGPEQSDDFEVIGVVKDAKYVSLRERPRAAAYYPYPQNVGYYRNFIVRSSGDSRAVIPEIRQAIKGVDRNLPVVAVTTLTGQVEESLVQQQLIARLSTFFGLVALVLACIGLYGIMSYAVARRTQEVGIRMALGAQRGDVIWLVMRETLGLTLGGVVLGVAGSLAATRLVASLLYGLTPTDPLAIGLATGLMVLVAALAGYLPARRASRVDPMVALRYE